MDKNERCTSRNPHGTALRCARTVPHTRHANCSIWWDDDGTGGVLPGWPRAVVPLFPAK